jgi:MFS-type transporter involved in bile tolerance (Atg22 family)
LTRLNAGQASYDEKSASPDHLGGALSMRNLFILMFMLAATVLAGACMMVVLAMPSLYEDIRVALPVAAGVGILCALPVAWMVASAVSRSSRPA